VFLSRNADGREPRFERFSESVLFPTDSSTSEEAGLSAACITSGLPVIRPELLSGRMNVPISFESVRYRWVGFQFMERGSAMPICRVAAVVTLALFVRVGKVSMVVSRLPVLDRLRPKEHSVN
jgi:hypothetical protein